MTLKNGCNKILFSVGVEGHFLIKTRSGFGYVGGVKHQVSISGSGWGEGVKQDGATRKCQEQNSVRSGNLMLKI